MRALLHRLAHAFGWWGGDVMTWWERPSFGSAPRLMVGFQCRRCGTREGIHEAPRWVYEGHAPPDEGGKRD